MKTVRVENNKVIVECDGARVSHSLATIQKCISKLEEDLEMWHNYERLLTQRAADGDYWVCSHCGAENILFHAFCGVCSYPHPATNACPLGR